MAKDPYLIRLSVHPYIRKYLLFHFTEPFFISERGYIPGYIFNTLKPMPRLHASEIRKAINKPYGSYFDIAISENLLAKRGYLTGDDVLKINEVIADLIHDEMYRLVQQLDKANYQVDQSIREFMLMYDFDEDELPFENLKRWYYRERLRVEARKAKAKSFTPQMIIEYCEQQLNCQPVMASNQVAMAM